MVIDEIIEENKGNIIDTIKILIYQEYPGLLKLIDFENNDIYLDSLILAYFNSKKYKQVPKEALREIMQGYFVKNEKIKIKYSHNSNEIAYIPKLGYFKNQKKVDDILINNDFEIVKEIHPVLEKYFVQRDRGQVINQNPSHKTNWEPNYKELFLAINIIREHLPIFYKELTFSNKKIYLHDNPNILNFTSFETLGMLYFYVIGENNLIYFIEELIHQGSHNYLYYIVHKRKDFFKIDVDGAVMKDYTKQEWDYRTIYGAFHGLFTITQRLVNFDKLLSQNVFSERNKHELLGRLTDQFTRFRTGLELLDLNTIYTSKGASFYKQLDSKCLSILNKYKTLQNEFDLSNRNLDFRYDDFCKLNPFEEFKEKEHRGKFNF